MGTATASTAIDPIPALRASTRTFVPAPTQFWFILAAYFVLHVITRTLVTEAAGIDEADQLVRGQHLSFGYGPQAPLYTWLMTFFLRAFGSSVFSLAVLRELMLFGIYAFTYLNARSLTRSHACGVVAAIALQFHPTIVWESQRELTHSILASCMVLLTLLCFQGLGKQRTWIYAAFGVSGGLAILSKYNAALVYAAVLLSALTIPTLRKRVLDWRTALAIGMTMLVLLPSLIWILNHRAEAGGSLFKFGIYGSMPWMAAVKTGLLVWVETAGLHIFPVVALFAILFGRELLLQPAASRAGSDEAKWLWRVFLILNLFVLIAIFAFKVTAFKDRWMQALFVWLPLLLVVVAQPFLTAWRLQTIVLGGALMTVVMAAIIPGRLFFTEARGRRDVLNAPFRAFARDLSSPVSSIDCLVANDYWLAGNLVLWFPAKTVYSLDLNPPWPSNSAQRTLLIWDASRRPAMPPPLAHFATNNFEQTNSLPPPTYFEEKWKFHKNKVMRLGLERLP